jgi:hypothetical protein
MPKHRSCERKKERMEMGCNPDEYVELEVMRVEVVIA